MKQPWATGPGEILEHGLSLLDEDTDKNRRLAMIAIDNSVELMIKTYIGLPKRVTGLGITRKQQSEASESFPKLLDCIEEHAADKLQGIDLGEIEWYHRLRNELYHQGNGLTVERAKVDVYAELAKTLFANLFGFDLGVSPADETDQQRSIGRFLQNWIQIERLLNKIILKNHDGSVGPVPRPPGLIIQDLEKLDVIDKRLIFRLHRAREMRNQLVHGMAGFGQKALTNVNVDMEEMQVELKRIAEAS